MLRPVFGLSFVLCVSTLGLGQALFEDALPHARRPVSANASGSPVRYHVFTAAAPATGLIPADYRDRLDSAADVVTELWFRGRLVAPLTIPADVDIAITGRTHVSKEDDIYEVRATVRVLGETLRVVGRAEDGNWNDAATDLVKQITKTVKTNESRILAARPKR